MTNHLMQNNSYPQSVNPEASRIQPQFSDHDEIDLKKLLFTLWKGKWLIVCSTFFVGSLALIYALLAPEVWTASAKVMKPKINDYYQLSAEVNKFQYVLAENSGDKFIGKSDLTSLVKADVLFKQYIDAFNSSINKKEFLTTNSIFLKYLENNEIASEKSTFVLNEWLKNIQAKAEITKRGISSSYYTLSSTSYSQESSYLLLKEYSSYITKLVYDQIVEGIDKTILSYTEELKTASSLLSENARNKLEMEKKKTEIALQITTKAAIDEPVLSYTSDELFPINLGKNANFAKKEALKDMTNLSIFEPELIVINSKLKFLSNNNQIDPDVEFSTIRYIEKVDLPLSKDKPKRTLIVVIGLLLGAMLGVAYVLLKQAFKE